MACAASANIAMPTRGICGSPEPALQFERCRLHLPPKHGSVNHAIMQQRMRAEETRPRASVAGARPDRQRRLGAHEIGADVGEDGERRWFDATSARSRESTPRETARLLPTGAHDVADPATDMRSVGSRRSIDPPTRNT